MRRLRFVMTVISTVAAALVALAFSATPATAITGPRAERAAWLAAGGAASLARGPVSLRGGIVSVHVGPALARAAGRDDYFNTDSCTSPAFCMAVGAYNLNGHVPGLSEMLSGGNWVLEPVPSPTIGVNVFANEVSCASPTSCLFVGEHWAGKTGPNKNLAEAWDGSVWRIITDVGPAGAGFSGLDDVACPSTKFCLAIGFAGPRLHYQATAYTWRNGSAWHRIKVPHPRRARNSALGGLACFSARNCMAVGNYRSAAGRFLPFTVRWHDGRWKRLATPAVPKQRFTQFQGVSCPTAKACVAVGETEDKTAGKFFHAFAEVWKRGKWQVSTLRRAPSVFLGASCPAWNRCFASGYTFPSGSRFAEPLMETWNGTKWRTQHPARTSAPNAGDVLEHVSCVFRTRCEAVGYSYNPHVNNSDKTLAEMWNGHSWTVQTTINP